MKRFCSLVFILLSLTATSMAEAKMPAKPEGRINDFAEMLTEDEEAVLQNLAEGLERTNGAQLAVVTVPSLDGMGLDEYANRLFKLWGIGHKGKDDGVLFLVSLEGLTARIEVGYGLEGVLNDSKVGRILDEVVMPQLNVRNFGEAMQAGTERIAIAIHGSAKFAAASSTSEPPIPLWLKIGLPIFVGFFITMGFVAFGAGFRGDGILVIWGALFGGIPLGFGILVAPALGYSKYLFPAWAFLMFLIGLLFCKRFLARYGGPWRVKVSLGFGGGRSSGSGSSGGSFGGGSSGGGGAGR